MVSSAWNISPTVVSDEVVYRRVLGPTERMFFFDTQFEGTSDSMHQATVQTSKDLFESSNVFRAWITLKRYFPLLGADIEQNGSELPEFVVSTKKLRRVGGNDIVFHNVHSAEAAQDIVRVLVDGKRPLPLHQPAQIHIVNRSDDYNTHHVYIYAIHSITDGIANMSMMKTFLDILASPNQAVVQIDSLEKRLALAVASEDLNPSLKLSLPAQRWRRAVATIIYANRMARIKGGHAFPRNITTNTPNTPAVSRKIVAVFSVPETAEILKCCRRLGITFGNAFPVLASVAFGRVLTQLYLAGEISQDEWEYRRRQPTHMAGPLNLRSFLDKQWLAEGGHSNVSLSINFFQHTLPFISLPPLLPAGSPLPDISTFMTPGRFLLRCKMIRNQIAKHVRHPLFLDINEVRQRSAVMLSQKRDTLTKWKNRKLGGQRIISDIDPFLNKNIWIAPQENDPAILTHGGSSFGNIDHLLPLTYPLSSPEQPSLRLILSATDLRCRPTELYLGAATSRNQLGLSVMLDANVYSEDLMKVWLDEVKLAISWFLGGKKPHQV